MTRPRSAGGAPPQAFDSSAACAALTARSMSAAVALATVASSPPDGRVEDLEGAAVGCVDAFAVDDELFGHGLSPDGAQRGAVVRPIDLRLDQARAFAPAPSPARDRVHLRSWPPERTPKLAARAGQSIAPSATPAGWQSTGLLFDLDQAERCVAEDDSDDAELLADRGQQFTDAHQQTAVARQRTTACRGRPCAAPIAAGSANPIVDNPFEISMPFGLLTGHDIVAGNMCAPASTVTRRPAASARRRARRPAARMRPAVGISSACCCRSRCSGPRPTSQSDADSAFRSARCIRDGATNCSANGTCLSSTGHGPQ